MAFPRLENDFDAPPQTIDREDFLEADRTGREGGYENGPVHEFQNRLGRIVAFVFLFCLHSSEVGRFSIHRCGYETDGGMRFIIKQHLQVEAPLISEQRWQIDGLARFWIQVSSPGSMPENAIGPGIPMSLDFIHNEIAAITQREVAFLEGQLWGGSLIVFAVRIDAEGEQVVVEQVVSGLDSGVANAGMAVGNAGEMLKEMAGQLDDRAVLTEDPGMVVKYECRLCLGRSAP